MVICRAPWALPTAINFVPCRDNYRQHLLADQRLPPIRSAMNFEALNNLLNRSVGRKINQGMSMIRIEEVDLHINVLVTRVIGEIG